jgi:hypothetical protein
VKAIGRALGSVFRGIYDKAGQVSPDDALLASIEKLNRVTDAMRDDDARGRAADDVASNR